MFMHGAGEADLEIFIAKRLVAQAGDDEGVRAFVRSLTAEAAATETAKEAAAVPHHPSLNRRKSEIEVRLAGGASIGMSA